MATGGYKAQVSTADIAELEDIAFGTLTPAVVNPTASGAGGAAIGRAGSGATGATASATGALAWGTGNDAQNGAQATADGAVAIGSGLLIDILTPGARATDIAAIALGAGALASGLAAQAYGILSAASGLTASAMGESSEAAGDFSLAFGFHAKVDTGTEHAMAFGSNANATASNQAVFGSTNAGEGITEFVVQAETTNTLRAINNPAVNLTGLFVALDKGAGVIFAQVEVGAADSGGLGKRALVIGN